MERPIIFSTPMVRAILSGQKTMTRRVVKPQPAEDTDITFMPNPPLYFNGDWKPYFWTTEEGESINRHCPYGYPGDRFWVKETFFHSEQCLNKLTGKPYFYKATNNDLDRLSVEEFMLEHGIKWRPSLYMPREAHRICLENTNVWTERLNDITEKDAITEGIEVIDNNPDWPIYKCYIPGLMDGGFAGPTCSFESLWNSINLKKYPSWNNPMVWVIKFKRIA